MIFEIQPGECFGCLALTGLASRVMWSELRSESSPRLVRKNFFLSTRLPFEIDDRLRHQIGESLAHKLRGDEVFVTFKRRFPDFWNPLTDGYGEERRQVSYFLFGLTVWLGIPDFQEGPLLVGKHDGRSLTLLPLVSLPRFCGSVTDLWSRPGSPIAGSGRLNTAVWRQDRSQQASGVAFAERVELGAEFADRLRQIIDSHEGDYHTARRPPRYWRANSGLAAFLDGCRSRHYDVRIHQYVRAIESFLPPTVFGEKGFTEKAGFFLDADPKTIFALGEMYRLRNKAEHHEYFEDANLSGAIPEETAWLRAWQAELLCLELYRRLFTKGGRFLTAYTDGLSIEDFWRTTGVVKAEWGAPFELPAP